MANISHTALGTSDGYWQWLYVCINMRCYTHCLKINDSLCFKYKMTRCLFLMMSSRGILFSVQDDLWLQQLFTLLFFWKHCHKFCAFSVWISWRETILCRSRASIYPLFHLTGHISTSVSRQVSFQCNSTPALFEIQTKLSVFSKVVYHIKIAHLKYSSN
jgi:hypothetical protein